MKIINKDILYDKENADTKRSIDMALSKLEERLSKYVVDQKIDVGKIFNDDVLMHDIINKRYYVYKCKANNMQIRLLYTVKNNKIILISHWYKKRTDTKYIQYFENIVANCS